MLTVDSGNFHTTRIKTKDVEHNEIKLKSKSKVLIFWALNQNK
jgi:hypothetical protein